MPANPKVDAYIAKAPPFAQPVLHEMRKRVHAAVKGVREEIKWNVPFFMLDGRFVASMAAFKAHAKVGVWSGMTPAFFLDVTDVTQLPKAAEFAKHLKAAAEKIGELNAAGKKPAAKKAPAKKKPATKRARR